MMGSTLNCERRSRGVEPDISVGRVACRRLGRASVDEQSQVGRVRRVGRMERGDVVVGVSIILRDIVSNER